MCLALEGDALFIYDHEADLLCPWRTIMFYAPRDWYSVIGLETVPFATFVPLLISFTLKMLSFEVCYLSCEVCLLLYRVRGLSCKVCFSTHFSHDITSYSHLFA